MQNEDSKSKSREDSPQIARIKELLEGDLSWNVRTILRQLEALAEEVVLDGEEKDLEELLQFYPQLCCTLGRVQAYMLLSLVIKRLLTKLIGEPRARMVATMLRGAAMDVNFFDVMHKFNSDEFNEVLEDGLQLRLNFLCEVIHSFSDAELSHSANWLQGKVGHLLPRLLIGHGNTESIAAIIRIASHMKEIEQRGVVRLLRKEFDGADLPGRKRSQDAIAKALPSNISRFADQAIYDLLAWGTALTISTDPTSCSLGQTIVAQCQRMRERDD